jgi:uncharacterized membrane protein YhaH (DUF805 family)
VSDDVIQSSNPYLAPGAAMNQGPVGATYEPRMLAWRGRIGRLRYMAYQLAIYLLTMVGAGIFFAFAAGAGMLGKGPESVSTIMLYMVVLYLPLIVLNVALSKRRFNDLNRSGWMLLLMIVPLVNVFVWLYLVCAQGSEGANDYGLPPGPDSLLIKIGGWLMPVLFILSIAASIAIPAYQGYLKAARQQSSNSF